MPNIVNASLVSYLKTEFEGVSSALFFNYQGMGVKKESELRGHLQEAGAKMEVVKNSVAKIAFKGTDLEKAAEYLKGPVAILFGGEDIVAVAKAAQKYLDDQSKDSNSGSIVGAVVEGEAFGAAVAVTVYKMPSKRDVQASIVGLALGPGGKLVSAITTPGSKIAGAIKAIIEKQEKEGAA